MANKRKPDLEIENAQIILRNFAGRAQKFTPAGERSFGIVVSRKDAEQLALEGWNVKTLKPRSDEEVESYFLPVKVSFAIIPPTILLVSDDTQPVRLTEETVDLLDTADILQADAVINPYYWNVSGKEGYKAYLKALYVTIQEDRFAKKYRFKE